VHFSFVFLRDLIQKILPRIFTILDLFVLCSWSPVWVSPAHEPAIDIIDLICYLRVILLNLVCTFSKSTGIWPDLISIVAIGGSFFLLSDLTFNNFYWYVSCFVLTMEFVTLFWSPNRRRQRKLWTHNATFRISQFRRNPFQRSIRRSLLLPLIRRDQHEEITEQNVESNMVQIINGLSSAFTDIIPEISGHNAEKRILHVHTLSSLKTDAKTTIIFLHQFGSGSFTWQSIMVDLSRKTNFSLLSYDRFAHGLTFASEPIDNGSEDSTPVGEDLSLVVHFGDAVTRPDFESWTFTKILENTSVDTQIVLVSAGGAGARIALDVASRHTDRIRKLVFVSPCWMKTDGIPSVLKSVTSAQVGRALVVSMAKSEVTEVLPRRSWHRQPIPPQLLDAYQKSVEVHGWEDAMLNLLRRPLVGEELRIPDVVSRIPCLLILGENDHLRSDPREYTDFASKFQQATVETIKDCGASPQEERPEEVSRIIMKFV
jgi:pimeloyl-ACP methyl ester carboxylesterase